MNDEQAPEVRYCVIDTEGNGLFRYKDENGAPVPADAPGQPRLASLSMILLNSDLSIEEEYSALVKPDGWTMSPEATAINGLTDERLMVEGKPVAEVLAVYTQAVREGYIMVAFNAQHDLKQIRSALRHAGMPDLFHETPNICVMRLSKGIIPRPDGKAAWPKLDHCREFLNLSKDGSHTALQDARDALAVFLYLRSQHVPMDAAVHKAAEPRGDGPRAGTAKPGDFDAPAAPVRRAAKSKPVAVSAGDEIPE